MAASSPLLFILPGRQHSPRPLFQFAAKLGPCGLPIRCLRTLGLTPHLYTSRAVAEPDTTTGLLNFLASAPRT